MSEAPFLQLQRAALVERLATNGAHKYHEISILSQLAQLITFEYF